MKMPNMKWTVITILLVFCVTALSGCGTEKTLFALCGKDIETWAKDFDASACNAVTVSVTNDSQSQKSMTVTDADTILEVFSALSSVRVKGKPDQGPIDFMVQPVSTVFSFQAGDGSAVNFLFLDKRFALGDPIGANGLIYDCTGADVLFAFAAQISDDTTLPTETGGNDFFSFFGDKRVSDFSAAFYTEPPTSISYTFNGEASGEPILITDPDKITAVYEALAKITVTGEADTMYTDNEHIIEFALQDGTSLSFRFNGHNLEWNGNAYTLDGDTPLWDFIRQLSE